MSEDYIRIYDTTLRDGEQTPGVTLTPQNKVKIAIQLDKIGVDVIEAGFPIISQGEMDVVKEIAKVIIDCMKKEKKRITLYDYA